MHIRHCNTKAATDNKKQMSMAVLQSNLIFKNRIGPQPEFATPRSRVFDPAAEGDRLHIQKKQKNITKEIVSMLEKNKNKVFLYYK